MAPPPAQPASPDNEAFQTAQERIAKLKGLKLTERELDFKDLPALKKIPEELNALGEIWSLKLSRTGVKSLDDFDQLKINVLDICETDFSSLETIVSHPEIILLYLQDTKITSIRDISRIQGLQSIDISKTGIKDLSPLAECVSLADGANRGIHSWLNTGSLEDEELRALTNREHPENVILTIDYLRRNLGLEPYWPKGYNGSQDIPNSKSDDNKHNQLPTALPGPHLFVIDHGKIEAKPVLGQPLNLAFAEEMLGALRSEISEVLSSFKLNYFDDTLERTLRRLLEGINFPADEIKIGGLQVQLRKLQGISTVYQDSFLETDLALSGILKGISETLADLTAIYPAVREMESSRVALGVLSSNELPQIADAVEQVIYAAQSVSIVGNSVIQALSEGKSDRMELIGGLRWMNLDVNSRAIALNKSSDILGQQLLSIWNLSTVVARQAGNELADVGSTSWKAFKEGVPDGVRKGTSAAVSQGIKIGLTALALKIAGPLGLIALAVPSFGEIAERLKREEH